MRSQCTILMVAALVPLTFALENITFVDDFDNRIVGGTLAQIRRFPSQVSFHIKGFGAWCGGTLISRRWVVSAAHCFYQIGVPASGYVVRAGSNFHYKGGAISDLRKYIIHPRYKPRSNDYDIAMVKLRYGFPKKVRNKYPIGFAELARQEPSRWSKVWATGWGANRDGGGGVRRLRKVRLKVIPRRYCNTKTDNAGQITKRMVCAGRLSGGKDGCQGDSGGPLYQGGRLVGVTSWGLGCARPNSPGVWTNVALLRRWIRRVQRRN